ncbi:peptidylprolyl isomerase [Aliikangiella coralliicola]|uniref:Peptidyl-prolyl cis-trans isomerase n=1 Tax=Aliikangiella coralliicola TaxID=2592383 RepID=A0A545UBK5_9GAMM|nr:peptidylprolyl isomerase [Aliikangiella coralliicola]TQV86844.1 peptidylprolyl isomerase [Aliikangiella coralliicola]
MAHSLVFKRFLAILSICFTTLIFSGCSEGEDPAVAKIKTFINQQKIDKNKAGWKRSLAKPPKLAFTQDKKYFWEIRTNKGNMKIELMPDVAPMHVSSTMYLTLLGFYDDLKFHRVIKGFMAQGGDPMGNGSGGPGYKYAGEFSASAKHDKAGILSMANAGPNTDGSQFFITFKATPHLNGRHTVFGHVVEGMDTLKKLESFGSPSGQTKEELKIRGATIVVEQAGGK